jgi:superfamily II DNA helicase RecQ
VGHLLPDDADIQAMIVDCLISLPKPMGRSGLARILAGALRAPATPDKARHHGRLKALGEVAILGYIDDLIEDGRLRQYERQGYSVLAPTMRGRAEAESWLGEHPELAAVGPAPEPSAQSESEPDLPSEGDKYTALQKAIWLWRRRLAEELGQPVYMLMSNDLILRIAETRPQTVEELAALPGMGAQRLEYYGPTLVDLVHLNPPQPGDPALLEAQRAAPRTQYQAPTAAQTVSPQIERRILLKLQELRQKQAIAEGSKPYLVASNALLKSIAQTAPDSLTALEQVPGFRQSGLARISAEILAFIQAARTITS